MEIYIYMKYTDDEEKVKKVVDFIRRDCCSIYVSMENRRSFYELEKVKKSMTKEDAVVIESLSSLGMNEAEIASQLEWFIQRQRMLAVGSCVPTYEFGMSQPTNMAALSVLKQMIISNNNNVVELPNYRRSNSGRSRIAFPDNWDELYEKWEKKEISSKEFLNQSRLKKGTFYNLLTEYKKQADSKNELIKTYDMRRKW
ncbi:hypothetical protein [Selenomonas sp. KH1T6]|uniref:hypothetical protein n=1 Tax=Selenomonas sp. KH1T6 TaxID=3158784 RepID=UPI0008A7C180|nr:hypothetical protein SAMN05216583_12119 [Selenomonas ruminantium]